MPTTELLEAAGSFLSLGFKLGILPFRWFPKRNVLAKSSKFHEKLWKLFVIILIFKLLHFGVVVVEGLNGGRSATKRSYDGLLFLSTLFTVLGQLIVWSRLDEIPAYYNSMHGFFRRIGKHNFGNIDCLLDFS